MYPADHGLVVLVLQAILGPHGLGAEDDAGFPGKEVSGLDPRQGNPGRLGEWIAAVRATDLPHLHAFTRGLDLDKKPCTRR